jgi:hypothetical protein
MRNGLHLVVAICCPEFIAQETFMRIVWIALFTVIFLGSTMRPGWCPQPAQAMANRSGSNGATGAAVYRPPPPYKPLTPKEMTPHQRSGILSREVGAAASAAAEVCGARDQARIDVASDMGQNPSGAATGTAGDQHFSDGSASGNAVKAAEIVSPPRQRARERRFPLPVRRA